MSWGDNILRENTGLTSDVRCGCWILFVPLPVIINEYTWLLVWLINKLFPKAHFWILKFWHFQNGWWLILWMRELFTVWELFHWLKLVSDCSSVSLWVSSLTDFLVGCSGRVRWQKLSQSRWGMQKPSCLFSLCWVSLRVTRISRPATMPFRKIASSGPAASCPMLPTWYWCCTNVVMDSGCRPCSMRSLRTSSVLAALLLYMIKSKSTTKICWGTAIIRKNASCPHASE